MNTLQQSFLKNATDNFMELDEWEAGFIRFLNTQPMSYELTQQQNKQLNKINTRLTAGDKGYVDFEEDDRGGVPEMYL